MRTSTILFSLFLAGAICSPMMKREIVYEEEVVYQTVTITYDGSGPQYRRHSTSTTSLTPTVTPEIASVTPEITSDTPEAEFTSTTPPPSVTPSVTPKTEITTSPPKPKSTTPPSTTPTPTPTPEPVAQPQASTESDGSPTNGGQSILGTCNKWRKQYGLPTFKWDSQLEKNALKTGTDGRGQNQVHQLNQGTMGQVITPGMVEKYGGDLGGDTPFELSYVAWLCEVPSDKLKADGKDQCKLVKDNLHMYYSDTGHYDILTSTSYSKIGCAFADNPDKDNNTPYQGLWVCDLGYWSALTASTYTLYLQTQPNPPAAQTVHIYEKWSGRSGKGQEKKRNDGSLKEGHISSNVQNSPQIFLTFLSLLFSFFSAAHFLHRAGYHTRHLMAFIFSKGKKKGFLR